MRRANSHPLLFAAACVALGCSATEAPPRDAPASRPARAAADRTVEVRYTATATDLPPNAPVRLWIPLPRDTKHQTVTSLSTRVAWPGSKHTTRETLHPESGNRVLYLEGSGPESTLTVTAEYTVERWTRKADLAALARDGEADALEGRVAQGLKPVSRIVVDERIQAEAADLAPAGTPTLKVARAFYDKVAGHMSYDKSGVGWGQGDSQFACSEGKGNCTDFHAYFMALCQARKIPSQFEIGLFGPYDSTKGETVKLGGYHCWAEFRVPGQAWVGVDISEGDKNPARYEACFGTLSANRVTLSVGRDLVLNPAQAGPPLNYHVNPYAEVAGKPWAKVSKTATWRDR